MKKTLLIAFVILMFAGQAMLSAQTVKEPSKKAVKLIKKAEKAIKDKEMDKAADFYRQVMEMEPEYAGGYFGMGRLQLAQNQLEEGEKNLEKALELNPGYGDAAKLLAKLLFTKGQQLQTQRKVDEANANYRKLTTIPGIAELDRTHLGESLYRLGVNLYTRKQFADSIQYLEKFQQLPMAQTEFAPLFPASNYIIGLDYSQLKNYEKSNEYLKKYIETRQDAKEDKLLPLAHFVTASNNFQKLEAAAVPIKKDKTAKDIKQKLAALAARYEDGIVPHLEKAIELMADLEPAYMILGNFHYYQNNLPQVIAVYEKMLTLFPNSPDKAKYRQFLEDVRKEAAKSDQAAAK